MLHSKQTRLSRLVSFALCYSIFTLAVLPLVTAQPTVSVPAPGPTQSPIPPPSAPAPSASPAPAPVFPDSTIELTDSQAVRGTLPQKQHKTFHFAIAQQQRLPVKRQLERIMFHPGADAPVLEKRQQPSLSPSPVGVPSAAPSPTGAAPAPLPSLLPNGTYAVFISISTCTTPQNVRQPLELYVSTSPIQDQKQAQKVVSEEGVIHHIAYASKELFFWVASPTLQGAAGADGWIVEVGASTQGYVQGSKEEFGLVLDDTDNSRASFLTPSFADLPPFNVYVVETERFPASLKNSLCAVKQISPPPLTANTIPKMDVTLTSRASNQDGLLGTVTLPHAQQLAQAKPRRQVLLSSLTPATEYTAIFVANMPNQAGAEVMYMTTPFRTKKSAYCALVTDLKYCTEVAYAVPITPPTPPTAAVDLDGVKKIYEDHVEILMHNFENVLAQYDCSKSQYSLIRNCTDCQLAYRRWLCSVSIPRCTDVEDVTDFRNHGYIPPDEKPKADDNPYLIDRSKGPVVVQRNTTTLRTAINLPENETRIDPGDFGEVLPCIDLCFDVVQSCPNFLGFGCPVKNMAGNYATMNSEGFQCNGLGLVPVPNEGAVSGQGWRMMQVVAMAVAVLLVGV